MGVDEEVVVNKIYRKIIVYRPSTNEVQYLKKIPYEIAICGVASDRAFYRAYDAMDKVRDVVIGLTMGRDMYQLSPAAYGSYVKESEKSMELFNRSKILCAIDRFHAKHNIPYDD